MRSYALGHELEIVVPTVGSGFRLVRIPLGILGITILFSLGRNRTNPHLRRQHPDFTLFLIHFEQNLERLKQYREICASQCDFELVTIATLLR